MNFPLVTASEASKCKLSDFFYSPQVKTLFANSSAGNGSYNDCYLGFEDFKYTSPVPVANFNGDVYFQLYESAAISKNCREPDTAWDFIKFLMGYDTSHPESDFDLTAFYADTPVQRNVFKEKMSKTFERSYEQYVAAGLTPPYPKEEAVDRAVAAFEKNVSLAVKPLQSNNSDFRSIWEKHYNDYTANKTTTVDMLKSLERELMDFLAKY